MKAIFLASFMLFCSGIISAQQRANVQPGVINFYEKGLQGIGPDFGNNPASENFYNQMRDKFANLGIEQRLELRDIEGSIYLNENFQLGKILFNGKEDRKMYMRYNAFNDEFEIKNSNVEGDQTLALLKNVNISCVLGSDTYDYITYLDKKDQKSQGYLKLVYASDHYKLFEQHVKRFKEGKEAKTSHAVSFPHRFSDEINFYIAADDGVPMYASSKKKDLVSMLREEHQQEVKDFIKKRNLDLKTKKGLTNLLVFAGNL